MEKFTNCIYVLTHKTAYLVDNKHCNKIGSTQHLSSRMQSYKTYYPIDKTVICYYYIKNYNCYQLDNDIKVKFNNNRVKLDSGTEFYYDIKLVDLEIFFDIQEIEYEKYNDIEYKMVSNYADMYKELLYDEEKREKYNLNQIINLKQWQDEAKIAFIIFLYSLERAGLIISPTGSGKSFLIGYLSIFEYINKYKNDVLIMTKRKEIFDKKFINDMKVMAKDYNIIVYDLINDNYDYTILNNQTGRNHIYIINTDKFIQSKKYNEYKDYSFGKIKLFILDECHWAGAELFSNFLEYIKLNVNDCKIVGFSATPIRQAEDNINRSLKIFSNLDNEFNIIYIRGYIKSIEQGDRTKTKWLILPTTNECLEENIDEYIDEYIDENISLQSASGVRLHISSVLNEKGIYNFLLWLNNFIIKSINKKGILWFANIKSLIRFYEFVENYKNDFINLCNIIFYATYSKKKGFDNTDDNIDKFKLKLDNAILLAVYRGTEGFDDVRIDFGFNLYIVKSSNPLLDQQKEGRVSRTFYDKQVGYYGFLANQSAYDYKMILSKRLGNWINFMKEFENNTTNNSIKCTENINENLSTHKYIDMIIDKDNIIEIGYDDIKIQIYKYSENLNPLMNLLQLKKYMHKINKNNILKNLEIIDTKEKYDEYAKIYDLPLNISLEDYNWIKFLRHDFNEYITSFYTIEELINLKIKNYDDYIGKSNKDSKIPNIILINNGIYNELNNHFNLNNIYSKSITKKF